MRLNLLQLPTETPNPPEQEYSMSAARLEFVSSGDSPTTYRVADIAARILDARRKHPEATVTLDMPARDRAEAVALLRLALSVLDHPNGSQA